MKRRLLDLLVGPGGRGGLGLEVFEDTDRRGGRTHGRRHAAAPAAVGA
jgi:uncharacterized protein YbaR (Trm112 family)